MTYIRADWKLLGKVSGRLGARRDAALEWIDMDSLEPLTATYVRHISSAMAAATGQWTGCDWSTEFGHNRLNLEGLTPSQAILMARATSGSESLEWREAAIWLRRVEQDAGRAEAEAATSVRLALNGDLCEALESAKRARDIEAHYREPRTWQPLCAAIQSALDDRGGGALSRPADVRPS